MTVAVTLNLGVEQKEPWKVPGTVFGPHPAMALQGANCPPILEMRRWKLRAISQGMAELPALQSPSLACHT